LPSLPPGALQADNTTCAVDGTSGASNATSSSVYSVLLSSPWCPVTENLGNTTNMDLRFNAPQPCQPRKSVSGNSCRFPFYVHGQLYTDCTYAEDVRPWCYTDQLMTVQEYCSGGDIDYCSHESSTCGQNALCVNTPTGPSCQCQDGYKKASDGACVDYDECAVTDPPCSAVA
ncbi:hypothetical protein HDU87_003780, partial [Geranomyces variabilis]